ncbi:MAG TPA: hypothetical protein VLF20_05780 [Patescibacteria group bacterium]|nr:hypothetical protein [Patescibacteria group bacterium]
MNKKITTHFDRATQFFLPFFTILGFLLTSLKRPEFGLIFNLLAQIFWLYSAWQAWKKADQIGIFLTTLAICAITLYGVINYWLL